MNSVVIVGAGIAGLACARRLARAGVSALVLDKGRGIGGRVATRCENGLQFDRAQYVTAKGEEFAAVLRDLVTAGDAAPWPHGMSRTRIVGTPGMVTLGKALAVGLDVRHGAQVTAVRPGDGNWQV